MNLENKDLTIEEEKQVVGGAGEGPDNGIVTDWCPFCGKAEGYYMILTPWPWDREFWHCESCGDITNLRREGRWVHGIVRD